MPPTAKGKAAAARVAQASSSSVLHSTAKWFFTPRSSDRSFSPKWISSRPSIRHSCPTRDAALAVSTSSTVRALPSTAPTKCAASSTEWKCGSMMTWAPQATRRSISSAREAWGGLQRTKRSERSSAAKTAGRSASVWSEIQVLIPRWRSSLPRRSRSGPMRSTPARSAAESQCGAVGEQGEAEAVAKVHRLGIVCPAVKMGTISNGRQPVSPAARPGLRAHGPAASGIRA